MKTTTTFLTYLRFEPKPMPGVKVRTYFMHITPPFKVGKPFHTTQKRAENFVKKVAREWQKGGFIVSGVLVKVNALVPPLGGTSIKELKANHEVVEFKV